jgi:hypothetical protein
MTMNVSSGFEASCARCESISAVAESLRVRSPKDRDVHVVINVASEF